MLIIGVNLEAITRQKFETFFIIFSTTGITEICIL